MHHIANEPIEIDCRHGWIEAHFHLCSARPPPSPATVVRKEFRLSELWPELSEVELEGNSAALFLDDTRFIRNAILKIHKRFQAQRISREPSRDGTKRTSRGRCRNLRIIWQGVDESHGI
jgi:hypothetical protein